MANELTLSYQGGGTLYAIIRRQSDGYAWNGTAFEVWSDANVATYDVSLTSLGGDLYAADFPSAIAAGDYRIYFYEQAGASPAITDLILRSIARHWDGAALASESDITLSSYALTTLESAKRYLRITDTSDDTLLTELINQVSAEIERICGIQFKARDRRERLNGTYQRCLVLKQSPVISINRLSWGYGPALTVGYSGSAISASVAVSDTALKIVSTASSGTVTTNTLLFTDYPTASLLVAAINAVSGWAATLTIDVPSADLNPLGGSDAKSRSVILTYPDRADITYHVDYQAGLIELVGWQFPFPLTGRTPSGYGGVPVFPGGHQYILVEYRAGYESIPDDVMRICNRMVQDAFYEGLTQRSIVAATLGPFSWKASEVQASDIRDSLAYYIDLSKTIGTNRL
jgi:hypothetical protein